MPLIEVKCKKCGAPLTINPEAKNYFCQYCGTPYVMEQSQEINQTFQSTNIGNVEHLTINDDGSGQIQQAIQSAEAHLALGQYEIAASAFRSLTVTAAQRYEGWWGLARTITKGFSSTPNGKNEFLSVDKLLQNALMFAPATEKKKIEEVRSTYCSEWNTYMTQLETERNKKFADIDSRCTQRVAPLQKQIQEEEAKIAACKQKIGKIHRRKIVLVIIVFAILMLAAGFIFYLNKRYLMSINEYEPSSFGKVLLASVVIGGGALGISILVATIIYRIRISPITLAIKQSESKANDIKSEIDRVKIPFESEKSIVRRETSWLDH